MAKTLADVTAAEWTDLATTYAAMHAVLVPRATYDGTLTNPSCAGARFVYDDWTYCDDARSRSWLLHGWNHVRP